MREDTPLAWVEERYGYPYLGRGLAAWLPLRCREILRVMTEHELTFLSLIHI